MSTLLDGATPKSFGSPDAATSAINDGAMKPQLAESAAEFPAPLLTADETLAYVCTTADAACTPPSFEPPHCEPCKTSEVLESSPANAATEVMAKLTALPEAPVVACLSHSDESVVIPHFQMPSSPLDRVDQVAEASSARKRTRSMS